MRYRFTKDDISIRRNHEGSWVLSILFNGHYKEKAYMYYSKAEAIKKFQQEFGTYPDQYKPVGVLPLCNFGGIAVMEFETGIDDYALVADNYGDGYRNLTKNKIRYNTTGEAYFIRNGRRWYLKEFCHC